MNTKLPKKMICYIRNILETILMLGSGPKPAFLTRHFTGIFDFFWRNMALFLPFQIFVMTVIPIQMNRDIFLSHLDQTSIETFWLTLLHISFRLEIEERSMKIVYFYFLFITVLKDFKYFFFLFHIMAAGLTAHMPS